MNRQRGFFVAAWAIPYILYAVAGIAILAAIGTVAYKVNHWCNAACAVQTTRADRAEAAIRTAQQRASAMALLWDKERQGREADARTAEANRLAAFVPVEAAARNLPAPVARVLFPATAARVLDAAVGAANAQIAGPATVPPEKAAAPPADPAGTVDVGGVVAWGIACAKQYAEVAAQVTGWQTYYASLQAAQLQEALH
jgi:hypothetical protein